MRRFSWDKIASVATRTANSLNIFQAISRRHARMQFEADLQSIMPHSKSLVSQPVLLDGTWDNPNYWLRVQLLLSALGIRKSGMHGLLGPHNARQQAATMRGMGISTFHDLSNRPEKNSSQQAREFWSSLTNASEILNWELPCQVPSSLLYDYILKRQRQRTVCIQDPKGAQYIREYLEAIESACKLFSSTPLSLFIASHVVGATSAWAWIALKHGVKVIVACGDNGLCRFWALQKPEDIFDFGNRIPRKVIESLPVAQQAALAECGEREVSRRLAGNAKDLGAVFAFGDRTSRIDKQEICDRLGWEVSKPIVAFYSSNWFDYPHAFGMDRFIDHWDLIQEIVKVAKRQKKVNWLFKGHPQDKWYGATDFRGLMSSAETTHIKISDQSLGGAGLLKSIDAFVTCHGTVGVEAAALGKPVLVAERGWYDQAGFVRTSDSREHFLELLASPWWEEISLAESARKARQFAGLYWGRPDWQAGFLMSDDSRQWEIYQDGKELIRGNMEVIDQELDWIRNWYQSGHPYYHVYKMLGASEYAVD